MDLQPNLHPLPSTDSPLPEILIPTEWLLPSSLSDVEASIGKTVQDPCSVCAWDGTLQTLFHFNNFARLDFNELQPSRCLSCKILLVSCHSVLQKISDRHMNSSAPDVEFSDAIIIIRGSDFTGAPNQNLPGQRAISIITDQNYSLATGFYLFIPAGQHRELPPSGLPTKRILTGSISSTSSASWAREKLETCLSAHEKCSASQNQLFLPTRLVDVRPLGPEGNVKLVPGLNLPNGTRYAALSYVWGSEKLQEHIKTTQSSLQGNLNEIALSCLPKTIRDAILFTRDLGLDFLWVDSLCIIQNDQEEWAFEAGRMYDVYKNSLVMLGALWGNDCDSGLFGSCAEWQSQPIATLRLGQDKWPLHISREHEVVQLNYSYVGLEPPLLTRAWCFQERLVPSRCIFFGQGELIFGCHEGVGCECGISYDVLRYPCSKQQRRLSFGDARESDVIHPPLSSGPEHGLRWVDQDPHKAWRQVVEEFCSRKLTSEKDRLIAVGAVAEQISYARPGERYLAGLWSNTLLSDLCWWVPAGNWDKGEEPGNKTNIPSWSWASRAKEVSYQGADSMTPTAEVIQVSCRYNNDNPFGVLLDSKLILRGRVMCWSPRATEKRGLVKEEGKSFLLGRNGTSVQCSCVSEDGMFYEEIPRGTFLFELGHWSGYNERCVFLILSCRDEESLIFSREGIITPVHALGSTQAMESIQDLSRKFHEHSYIRECTIV